MHKQEIHAGGEIFQRLPDFTKDNLHFTGVMDRERPGQCGEIVICSTLYLIIADPANYLKYYIGYVKFLELKKCWAEKMGEDFSQKEFHRAVLSVGPAPFDVVETYMWNYAQK